MSNGMIGKKMRIVDDPLDLGREAVVLDYREADGTCDIKVLLPDDRKRIRKIKAECLMDEDIPENTEEDERIIQEGVLAMEEAEMDAMVQKREEPELKDYFKKHESQIFDYANDPEFKRFIVKTIADALAAYLTSGITESVSNSKRTWHP